MKKKAVVTWVCGLFALGLIGSPLFGLSGLQGEKIAESVLSPRAKGQLISARSSNEGGVDVPDWTYLYFDPYAQNNGRLVTIHNGAIRSVEEGFVELDHARLVSYKREEAMPLAMIRYDSPAALELIRSRAQIQRIRLSSVHYELKIGSTSTSPVWSLALYAFSAKNRQEVRFASARVSAITGQIFSLEVDLDKLQ